MFLSSTPRICALADNSDQVRRRRFFTFSITSGHNLRSPATSMESIWVLAGAEVSFVALLSSLTTSAAATSLTALAGASRFASAVAELT